MKKTITFLTIIVGFFILNVFASTKNPITSIPDLTFQPNFKQWTGYVTVRPEPIDRNIFYWFVESQNNPSTDPVVLWLTGGPGCSGLLALFGENGPYRFSADGNSVVENPYAWNKIANVIYIESPSGVGFSYAGNKNYTTGDKSTAIDNYSFLKGFFELFPSFANNEFIIFGESYAGHYVPQLADLVYSNLDSFPLKFKGYAVGNPSTDDYYDTVSYIHFMYAHAFVSEIEYDKAVSVCNGNFYNGSSNCKQILEQISNKFYEINPYDVYYPCIGRPAENGACAVSRLAMSKRNNVFSQTFVPCMNYTSSHDYFNREDVQQAIHAVKPVAGWSVCSSIINYVQYATTVLPIYRKLVGKLDQILVYSGDVDSCVNYRGTEDAITSLGYNITTPWTEWWVIDPVYGKQLGGYYEKWNKLTYLTVRGAGHMVPFFKPVSAFKMFSSYLSGGNY